MNILDVAELWQYTVLFLLVVTLALKWLCLMLNCQIKEKDNYPGREGIWLLRQDVFRIRTGCLENVNQILNVRISSWGDMMREIVSCIENSAISSSQREGDLPCWAICLTGLNQTLTDKVLVSEHSFHTLSFFFLQNC